VVTRVVEVPPERLVGWVERYRQTHPAAALQPFERGLRLADPSGADATLLPLLPFSPGDARTEDELVAALAEHAVRPVRTALLLLRRGGYAVGIADGRTLMQSKVGGRYVQSRTAAGGWSQQRFARRREVQVQHLVGAAAHAWSSLPIARDRRAALTVTGGDRSLCDRLLRELAGADRPPGPAARHLDVPDPRLDVLRQAAERAQALVVTVHEP
jgi:Actinobacteria/chloroflexi VLRF1 release factor